VPGKGRIVPNMGPAGRTGGTTGRTGGEEARSKKRPVCSRRRRRADADAALEAGRAEEARGLKPLRQDGEGDEKHREEERSEKPFLKNR